MAENAFDQASLDRRRHAAQEQSRAGSWKYAAATYARLWNDVRDPEDGAAYLRSLRGFRCHAEALSLAEELNRLFPDSAVCRREVQKTWFVGRVLHRDPGCTLAKLVEYAETLRDPLRKWAMPLAALAVMEEAVRARRWDLVKAWADESDPLRLRTARRVRRDNGINPEASWYDCMVEMLLGTGRAAAALDLLYRIPVTAEPEHERFLKHRLDAYLLLDSPQDALAVYAEFAQRPSPPRWAFVDAARLLRNLGDIRSAVVLLCRVLIFGNSPGETGRVMLELSDLMLKIGWHAVALKQLVVVIKQYRDQGWAVPPRLYSMRAEAEAGCGEADHCDYGPATLRDCLDVWEREARRHIALLRDVDDTRRVRHGLKGTLQFQPDGWTVRMANGLVFPCAPADVPEQGEPSGEVMFDAVPAFNRPRGVETWRAGNVRPARSGPATDTSPISG